ncbi:MAG: hypothetical protein KBF12_02930 [Sebaldella sp.]|nr:hypothetical protein [Sebaldella sp.]
MYKFIKRQLLKRKLKRIRADIHQMSLDLWEVAKYDSDRDLRRLRTNIMFHEAWALKLDLEIRFL